jgi:2-keto-3-deoxy-6-phosphogluconate aldolase
VGSLLGQHRDDARLAGAGAVLFAASFLLLKAAGANFDLPSESVQPNFSPATLKTQSHHPLPALPALSPAALP